MNQLNLLISASFSNLKVMLMSIKKTCHATTFRFGHKLKFCSVAAPWEQKTVWWSHLLLNQQRPPRRIDRVTVVRSPFAGRLGVKTRKKSGFSHCEKP